MQTLSNPSTNRHFSGAAGDGTSSPADSDAAEPGCREAYEAFQQRYPEYAATRKLDELRHTEYGRLDQQRHVYLDYTGGGLYAESQLREHMALLSENVFGNPHSKNPTSMAMTELVEHARQSVLAYFNASPDEYVMIFTSNCTGSLKLIAEAYPFAPGDHYMLTFDNHNSVNGVREFARAKGAAVTYIPVTPPDLRLETDTLTAHLQAVQGAQNKLFAYPAQSNFSGVQHPLEWIALAQSYGWDVLLDAAAFTPTSRLDLSQWHPDFVVLSFYKIFGYPTGIGGLLVRRSVLNKLRRPWYAGGTSTFSSVLVQEHYLTPGEEGFEDGTVNYLGLPAVEIGLRWIESVGLDLIHTRVTCLTGWLIEQLLELRHSNGKPVVCLYGPAENEMRGGTVEVNFLGPDGELWDCFEIEKMANERRISLRAGCHCNPGARELSLGLTQESLEPLLRDKDRLTYEQFLQVIDGNKNGAVRASVGIASTFEDVYRYQQFASAFIDRQMM